MGADRVEELAFSRAQRLMAEEGIAVLLAVPVVDVLYLSRLSVHPGDRLELFILPVEGNPIMLGPELQAAAYKGAPPGVEVRIWKETQDPFHLVREIVGQRTHGNDRVAVSERMHAHVLLSIRDALPDLHFVSAKPIVSRMRMIKSPDEIEALRKAAHLTDQALSALWSTTDIRGLTERQLQVRLRTLLMDAGLGMDREVFVVTGPETGHVAHKAGERVISEGDPVLIDLGGGYNHYISDMTRMAYVGKPSEDFERVFDIVKHAQRAAVEAVAPGFPCQHVDRTAREHIKAAGYGEYFVHRTGHGLGLEGHELPSIVEGNTTLLEPGMVFTVEPGIYLPQRFGARVEDMVVVTEDGVECLTHSGRDLIVVA